MLASCNNSYLREMGRGGGVKKKLKCIELLNVHGLYASQGFFFFNPPIFFLLNDNTYSP